MFRCLRKTPGKRWMATSTGNSAFNMSYSRLPVSDCFPWLVVIFPECLAIVILNIIAIIVFVKQRQLQRRSTYLIIHLAMVDLLVGAVSGPLDLVDKTLSICDVWEYSFDRPIHFINRFIILLFYFTSIVNLAVISLERLHATFCPFRHRLLKKLVYGVTIGAMWFSCILVGSVPLMLYESMEWNIASLYYNIRSSLCLLVLLVICTSYILIYVKVRFGAPLQHHGAANREKQLTVTLLLVTLVSLLTWLPSVALFFLVYSYKIFPWPSSFYISNAFIMLTLANSLVNPIMYTIRMPEFRTTVSGLFRRPAGRIEIPVAF